MNPPFPPGGWMNANSPPLQQQQPDPRLHPTNHRPMVVVPSSPSNDRNVYQNYQHPGFNQAPQFHPQLPTPPQHVPFPSQPIVQPQNPWIPNPSFSFDEADDAEIKPVIRRELPVDYRLLLLSLADQYIGEARSIGALVAYGQDGGNLERYYKLMSTGMGCLETILKKYSGKIPPRQEALLQLRYATLLYEDTDNATEAEELLTRSIAFCERNRLQDLKYSLQHLLVRQLSQTSARASLKYLDNVISDATTCRHIPWVYVFKFLRVRLTLELNISNSAGQAINHLHEITEISKRTGDSAICFASSAMQALAHLQIRKGDYIGGVQEALATANAQLFSESTQNLAQLRVLVFMLDLFCALEPYTPSRAREKVQHMEQLLDAKLKDKNWRNDSAFQVPIQDTFDSALLRDTGGIFSRMHDGSYGLNFSWLRRSDVFSLGYVLSAAVHFNRNPHENHKSEVFLHQALDLTEDSRMSQEAPVSLSLPTSITRADWGRKLHLYVQLQLTYAYAGREDWISARKSIHQYLEAASNASFKIPDDFSVSAAYLSGVISQGTGDFDNALACYNDPYLALNPTTSSTGHPTASVSLSVRDVLAILARLNTLLIIRDPTHHSHQTIPSILDSLAPYFTKRTGSSASTSSGSAGSPASANPHLVSAYQFLIAILPQNMRSTSYSSTLSPSVSGSHANLPTPTAPTSAAATPSPQLQSHNLHMQQPSPTQPPRPSTSTTSPSPGPNPQSQQSILPIKTALQSSMNQARSVQNSQLVSMSIAYLHSIFFGGIVGEQAVKGAKAARTTAIDSGSRVWRCVGCGLLRETLERCGVQSGGAGAGGRVSDNDAEMMGREGERLLATLPQGLRDRVAMV